MVDRIRELREVLEHSDALWDDYYDERQEARSAYDERQEAMGGLRRAAGDLLALLESLQDGSAYQRAMEWAADSPEDIDGIVDAALKVEK